MRNENRRQLVARATQARQPRSTGGTSAPRSAAGGSRYGLGRAQKPPSRIGLGQATPANPKVAAGAGTPGAAAAPASPYKPTPWNSKAEEIVAGARRKYLTDNVNFDAAEQQAKQDFGLDPGFNDYKTNPYSRAALLEESYKNANRGTMNSAGLQLYAGSTSNALFGNRAARDQNYNSLAKLYQEALGEISAGRTKAAEEKAEKEREAEWERIAAAEGAELDPEAAPGGGGGGSAARRSKPKQQNRGGGGNKGPAIAPRRKAR